MVGSGTKAPRTLTARGTDTTRHRLRYLLGSVQNLFRGIRKCAQHAKGQVGDTCKPSAPSGGRLRVTQTLTHLCGCQRVQCIGHESQAPGTQAVFQEAGTAGPEHLELDRQTGAARRQKTGPLSGLEYLPMPHGYKVAAVAFVTLLLIARQKFRAHTGFGRPDKPGRPHPST